LNENLGLQAKYKQINKKIFFKKTNKQTNNDREEEFEDTKGLIRISKSKVKIPWFQQNTLIQMLHSSSQTLEVAS
jgi:hypothetical protein